MRRDDQMASELHDDTLWANTPVEQVPQPGQLVGWSGFLEEARYTAGATCQADSRLLAFDGAAFMSLLESDAELGFLMLRRITNVISSRLRNIQRFVLKTL